MQLYITTRWGSGHPGALHYVSRRLHQGKFIANKIFKANIEIYGGIPSQKVFMQIVYLLIKMPLF